jgi:hypothetical protein
MADSAIAMPNSVTSVASVNGFSNNRFGPVDGFHDRGIEVLMLGSNVELTARCQLQVNGADLVLSALGSVLVNHMYINSFDSLGETSDHQLNTIAYVTINNGILTLVVHIDSHGHVAFLLQELLKIGD